MTVSCDGKGFDLKMKLGYTWLDNKVRELIAVKVLHTSLLKTTVVAGTPLGKLCTDASA